MTRIRAPSDACSLLRPLRDRLDGVETPLSRAILRGIAAVRRLTGGLIVGPLGVSVVDPCLGRTFYVDDLVVDPF